MDKIEIGIRMEADYFGPLWRYVKNERITDIDYNGSQLWITDVGNVRYLVENSGITDKFVEQFSHRIANEVSKPFNKKCNLLEAETDTLRISIVHESVAISGRSICIRKSLPRIRMNVQGMVEEEYTALPVIELLANCVAARMNFVFCGEPGAGKTECAKFFSQFIPPQERVITIEDNPEWHYSRINRGKDCVELRIGPEFGYTKAIKTCLRQNPSWIMLSEARSTEVKSLLECWSTGIRGFTTLHTDDVQKIPDRILNMMESRLDADRMENDVYSYVDVGILLRKKLRDNGKVYRYIDQVCFFLRENSKNMVHMQVQDGNLLVKELPERMVYRMNRCGIRDPYENRPFESYWKGERVMKRSVTDRKDVLFRYGKLFLLLLVASFLLQLSLLSFAVCAVVWLLVCLKWRKLYAEAVRQKQRLGEAEIYMEQMLYAFLQEQKILSAMEDVYPLFEDGSRMQTVLGKAIEHIKCDCSSNVEQELKEIEQAYENERLTEIHHYLLSVERYGGEIERPIEFLLENVRRWMERVRIYQADCRKYQRNVGMAVALSVIVCAITNSLLPDSVAISHSMVCQAASVLLICLDMLICLKCVKRTGRDWLKSYEPYEKESYQKEYRYVKEHEGIKSRWYRKQLTKRINRAFPQWLMDISLLLQTENVQVALYKTRAKAPKVLKPAIDEMLEQLERNPESIRPYQDFLKEYDLPDVRSAMRMLYALSNGGYGNGERQMQEIMMRNQELLDRAERRKNEDSLAGLYALFLAPALTGAGKMMVDMTMFLIAFLAQTRL